MGYTKLNNIGTKREDYDEYGSGLRTHALRFIRETCENLRFADKKKDENYENCTGKSIKENQIPYNMEKDIDRLCLERALERFLKSGKKEDAFDVYFCYLDMFVGSYDKTRKMIDLLSEYEANGSRLLMKHRDHYSHTVYVFALGLAIYESNSIYRESYKKYYRKLQNKDDVSDSELACHFLKYWGFTSLFHDIGYAFELPFEQVASYFEVQNVERKDRPYVAYHGLDSYVAFGKEIQRKIRDIYHLGTDKIIRTSDELFAYSISRKLSGTYYFSEEEMLDYLHKKGTEPNKFSHYMDHAYFSATVLFKKMFGELHMDLNEEYVDALTAIILHNSLYKRSIAFYDDRNTNIPFNVDLHPLAYMLMLCDELQCWDRVSYGRSTKRELHPMGATFDLSNDCVKVIFFFDKKEEEKAKEFDEEYKKWKEDKRGKRPKFKEYSSIRIDKEELEKIQNEVDKISGFESEIRDIVDIKVRPKEDSNCIDYGILEAEKENRKNETSGKEADEENSKNEREKIELDVYYCWAEREKILKKSKRYLSESNFINLYNFAVVLNARWELGDNFKESDLLKEGKMKEFTAMFDKLSLEYKLSNINQAKGFAEYMDKIGCFYTDRPVEFDLVEKFEQDELEKIAKLEHRRWLQEHADMGWINNKEDLRKEFSEKAEQNMKAAGIYEAAEAEAREKIKYDWIKKDYSTEKDFEEKLKDEKNKEKYETEVKEKTLKPEMIKLRENSRIHWDMIFSDKAEDNNQKAEGITQADADAHYSSNEISDEDKEKDSKAMECMLTMLRVYDGVRIYRLKSKETES